MHRTPCRRLAALAAVGSIVLVSTLGLAACAPEPEPSATSQAAAATETPEPAPEPVAGDILTPEEAEQINASWGLATDDKAYHLPTGEWVLIKGNEPLPANVTQAIEAAIVPPYTSTFRTHVFDAASQEAANSARDAQEAATGRKAAIVIHGMSALPDGSGGEPMWGVDVDSSDGYTGPNGDEAIAAAQKWVDQSPNTRWFVVVDALG